MSDIGEDIPFKFIGNNVNKKGVPTLITSEMMHMFSVMAVRNRAIPFWLLKSSKVAHLELLQSPSITMHLRRMKHIPTYYNTF